MSNTKPREQKLSGLTTVKILSSAWNVSRIALNEIFIPENYRPCQQEHVRALAASMTTPTGLRTPITVWKSDGQGEGVSRWRWVLIAGRHRFEAAKSLNWTHIDSLEMDGTLQQARYRAWAVSSATLAGSNK
jgi:hypothetical protein